MDTRLTVDGYIIKLNPKTDEVDIYELREPRKVIGTVGIKDSLPHDLPRTVVSVAREIFSKYNMQVR